jgi:hypothetical protein
MPVPVEDDETKSKVVQVESCAGATRHVRGNTSVHNNRHRWLLPTRILESDKRDEAMVPIRISKGGTDLDVIKDRLYRAIDHDAHCAPNAR